MFRGIACGGRGLCDGTATSAVLVNRAEGEIGKRQTSRAYGVP